MQHKEDANRNDLLIWASARGLISDVSGLSAGDLGKLPHVVRRSLVSWQQCSWCWAHNGLYLLHDAWLHAQAKELVSQGALPTTKDKKGLTPLHYAASHGHKDVSGRSS